jgi:hypothetical protein
VGHSPLLRFSPAFDRRTLVPQEPQALGSLATGRTAVAAFADARYGCCGLQSAGRDDREGET